MTGAADSPVVTGMEVIPVAGHDSMLLNLSGAHGPYFTRNIVILQDAAGRTGVGETPGGERIRETLAEVIVLFSVSLKVDEKVRRRGYSPEWR